MLVLQLQRPAKQKIEAWKKYVQKWATITKYEFVLNSGKKTQNEGQQTAHYDSVVSEMYLEDTQSPSTRCHSAVIVQHVEMVLDV